MRSFLRPETAFFLLVWLGCQIAFREKAFNDPGSLWHIRVGELILDHGFMTTDPFTYTQAGRIWIPQQWGAEVLMALAHRTGGLDLLLLGLSTLLAALSTWVFVRMRRAGMHPLLAGLLTCGALVIGAFHFFARPHMSTILFMAWTMACLVDYERGRASLWRLAGLIPLFIIWTNLHGGVLGGVVTLGLAVAGWGGIFLLRGASPVGSYRELGALVCIVTACVLTPLVNPFGLEMILTWQRIVGSDLLKQVVSEHKPLDPASTLGQGVLALGLVYVLLLAGSLPARPRVTWLLPLVWLALTVKGIRQGPLFAVTAAVTIADIWPHTVWCRLLKRYGDSLVQDPPDPGVGRGWKAYALPALGVLTALALQIGHVSVPVVGHGWARLSARQSHGPVTAALMDQFGTPGAERRIYNDANLGGYLLYHFPQMKIYMDDRFELYGDEWTSDYVDMFWHHPERIEGVMDRYDLDLALVVTYRENRSPLDEYLSGNSRWSELARTEEAVLFRRMSP